MSENAHRTLRIPDDVREQMRSHGQSAPLWYVGPLQAENGIDIEVDEVSTEEVERFGLPTEPPATVRRPVRARRSARGPRQ